MWEIKFRAWDLIEKEMYIPTDLKLANDKKTFIVDKIMFDDKELTLILYALRGIAVQGENNALKMRARILQVKVTDIINKKVEALKWKI